MRGFKFIAFGELAPDSRDIDTEAMDRTIGLIPLHGEYRSMPKLKELTSLATAYPINGSHVHLITPERTNQQASPIDDGKDNSATEWKVFGPESLAPEDISDEELLEYWWRITEPVQELTGLWISTDAVDPVDRRATFLLNDLEDPLINLGHFLRVRFRVVHKEALPGGFSINIALFEAGVIRASGTIDDDDYEEAYETDGWKTFEYELDTDEVDDIVNYEDLTLDLTAFTGLPDPVLPLPVPVVEVVAQTPETWDKEPDDEDVAAAQILSDDDENTYIYLDGPEPKGFEALLYDVVEPADLEAPGNDWSIFIRAGSEDADLDVTLKLMELDNVIAERTTSISSGVGFTLYDNPLLQSELVEIEDYKSLSVIAQITNADAAALQTLRPSAQISNVSFTPSNNIHTVVGDDNPATYGETSAGGRFKVRIPNPSETPPDGSRIRVKARVTNVSGAFDVRLIFGSGSTEHVNYRSGVVYGTDKEISGSALASGVNWSDAWLEVRVVPDVDSVARILECWVEAEGEQEDFEVKVAEIGIKSPTELARIEVCFAEYDLPVSKPTTPGDTSQIYCGNEKSLYEVGQSVGFQDRSQEENASYGASPYAPTSWEFASWGNRVVATNGSDPIQYQEFPKERFVDLLDTDIEEETEIFTARFLAVARDFLFCGNLLHEDDPEIGEFTIWWSAINNPRLFKYIDLTTMSDYQNLVTTPGSITGMKGGEFISVAKRTSIYRGVFTGPPLVWDMQVASYDEGTMYGKSIVHIDRDLFFFGSGGFRHLPYGSGVIPIGDGKITKMITDRIYEDRSIIAQKPDDLREIQNALQGTYDQWSRLIFWIYRGAKDNAYKNRFGIVYNPWQDQWSILDLPLSNTVGRLPALVTDSGYSSITSLPTLPTKEPQITRGLVCFGYTGSEITMERANSESHYPVVLKTKIFSSGLITGQEGKVIRLHGVRFFQTVDEDLRDVNYSTPRIVARVEAATDPHFACDLAQAQVVSGEDNENENDWLMFDSPLVGEFFRVNVEYIEIRDELIKELIGFEVDWEAGSAR